MTTTLFGWLFFIYLGAFVLHVLHIVLDRESFRIAGLLCAASGLAAQSAAIVLRWVESYRLGIGHAPLSNFYESLVFFSWSVIVVSLLMRRQTMGGIIGSLGTLVAFLMLAYASLSENVTGEIQPLIPALQSNWLASHVISSFLAYACFAVSFCVSLLYLIRLTTSGRLAAFLPGEDVLDDVTYRMISIGFVLLTLGIITGAAWAERAWGRYWGWDPKETWSLITWLIYGTFLHARIARGWKGTRMCILSLIGFAAVIFTYLGVNYILAGLHSYM